MSPGPVAYDPRSMPRPRAQPWIPALAVVAVALGAAAGCRTRDPYADILWFYKPEPGEVIVPREQHGPRQLAMFHGTDGQPLDWNALWNGMRWADIVIIGEQHDDGNAHLVQQALYAEAVAAWPGSVISMEMLERDEQPAVDEYLTGAIGEDEFIERTGSRDWAGKDTWVRFYQPMVDEARRAKCRVVAANAPRGFVRMARTDGWDALRALPPEDQRLFSLPRADAPASYRARFAEFMAGGGEHPADDAAVDQVLRAQRLWDSTMADSVVEALHAAPSGAKVVHVVGQFHSEYDGGLVSEIQARAPFAKVLTVTVQRGDALALRPEDAGKADVVVYGPRPNPQWRGFIAGSLSQPTEPAREEELPSWGFAY